MSYQSDLSSTADTLDVREIIERVEELEGEQDAFEQDDEGEPNGKSLADENPDEAAELATLSSLLSDLKGRGGDEQWRGDWYPITLIHEHYFEEAMEEMVKDLSLIHI